MKLLITRMNRNVKFIIAYIIIHIIMYEKDKFGISVCYLKKKIIIVEFSLS